MTKKILAMLLAVMLLCTLAACGNKEEGVIDDPVINLGNQALTFADEDGNTYTYDYLTSTTIEIIGYTGYSDEPHAVTIPASYDGYAVAAIGAEAFYANSSISSLTLPEGLISVGEYAFANCEAMASVTFPATLEKLEKGAFYGCDILAAADLSKTALVSIGANAFADSPALATANFPATLETVGASAFLNCTALTAITLPEGVTAVETQAFYNCTAAKTLSLPATLTEIGDWAFNPTARDLEDAAITVPADSYAAEYLKTIR